MPNPESITQWGLAKAAFATMTKDGDTISAFGTPHHQVGAISANVSFAANTNNIQSADNGKHYGGEGTATVTIEFTCAKFDSWFKTNVLGYFTDGGGLGLGDGETSEVAALFEVNQDQGGKRFMLYDATSSQISVNYATTTYDGQVTYATETVTLTGTCVILPNGNKRSYFEVEEGDTGYSAFFEEVYYPAA